LCPVIIQVRALSRFTAIPSMGDRRSSRIRASESSTLLVPLMASCGLADSTLPDAKSLFGDSQRNSPTLFEPSPVRLTPLQVSHPALPDRVSTLLFDPTFRATVVMYHGRGLSNRLAYREPVTSLYSLLGRILRAAASSLTSLLLRVTHRQNVSRRLGYGQAN
jgi:hypothetical protein